MFLTPFVLREMNGKHPLVMGFACAHVCKFTLIWFADEGLFSHLNLPDLTYETGHARQDHVSS